MVTVDDAIIAKFDKDGHHFEVLVDSEMAYRLKTGEQISISNMLAVEMIFKDAKKAEKISTSELEEVFGTQDILTIVEEIVKNGDIQLTTDFRKKKIEEKTKRIASLISKNAMDPKTKLPHPIERVLNAMEKTGLNIDPFTKAEQQMDKVIEAIRPIIPISMEKITLSITVPVKYAGQSYGIIKKYNVKKDEWLKDGSLKAEVEVSASLKDEVFGKLGSLTGGEAEIIEK